MLELALLIHKKLLFYFFIFRVYFLKMEKPNNEISTLLAILWLIKLFLFSMKKPYFLAPPSGFFTLLKFYFPSKMPSFIRVPSNQTLFHVRSKGEFPYIQPRSWHRAIWDFCEKLKGYP